MSRHWIGTAPRVAAGAIGIAATGYAALAAFAWYQYGRPPRSRSGEDTDPLLDQFMPDYEVVERHHVAVHAPAEMTFAAALEQDLQASIVIRSIFKARELILGSTPNERRTQKGLLPELLFLGWSILAERQGREVVLGAVTKPWEPNVVFQSVLPADFAGFDEPDHVKIVVSLRADALSDSISTFRTETRAVATDAAARARFRRYWALVSPGVSLIRRMTLAPLKAEAERRARREQLRDLRVAGGLG